MTSETEDRPFDPKTKKSSPKPLPGEEIVISGISGIYPKSDDVLALMDNLYGKVDMATVYKYESCHPEMPPNAGLINGTEKFDAQFFRVTYSQAKTLDPLCMKLLEQTYCAIYDSGINPLQFSGKKVGVFVGHSYADYLFVYVFDALNQNTHTLTGANKTMLANRISYWLNLKAPSYVVDAACCSSSVCLEHAYQALRDGICEAAIVGSGNIFQNSNAPIQLKRAGFLSMDGKTKCFDKTGDGHVRSESVGVILLQKAKDAKRIYAEVYHTKVKYGIRQDEHFLTPLKYQQEDFKSFLDEFYSEIDVMPEEIEYIEANGAAIADQDANELEAIGQFFGKDRTIKVGCVKSNMGDTEPSAALTSVVKLCLAYQKGVLPANIHCCNPIDDISSIREGKIQLMLDHAPFGRGFAAVNNYSFTGIKSHVLLKCHYKAKDDSQYQCSIPRLVLVSGRQEAAVDKVFDKLKVKVDPEIIGMLHDVYETDTPGHTCRGYIILDENENKETITLAQSRDYFAAGDRPLWLVFSGMGSQWPGMGDELMKIPTFAAAIKKCDKVLRPRGIDIFQIISERNNKLFDNIINSFVGIAAVQIGLTDVLKELGIKPDNIIGHSAGELGCAYFDNCFTAEEMILTAYSRGVASTETPLIQGAMAAVGLGYKDVLPLCPPEIDVACHNSFESATLSGPVDDLKKFVGELTSRGIFAKEVPTGNISFHSRYIKNAGEKLLELLTTVIKEPKLRSSKWVCTSALQTKWDSHAVKYSSAEYHTNNLLSPVYFEEAARQIPSNAVVIEVAPHGLLQAILKRSHRECTHIPLTRRGNSHPVSFLLEAIGKIYQEGFNATVSSLYPKIEFPVSTETPPISHYIEFEHSETWPSLNIKKSNIRSTKREINVLLQDDEYSFLGGNVRNGEIVLGEAAILFFVWETYGMYKGHKNFTDMSVVFTNVHFLSEIFIKDWEERIKIVVLINKGNQKFEVTFKDSVVVSGVISEVEKIFKRKHIDDELWTDDIETLNSNDVYRLMNLKGFSYTNSYRSIHSVTKEYNKALLKWSGNWITFIDALIQLKVLTRDYEGMSTPKIINRLCIDINYFKKCDAIKIGDESYFVALLSTDHDEIESSGVSISSIIFNDYPVIESIPDVIASRIFMSHTRTIEDTEMEVAVQIDLQIVLDNVVDKIVLVTEICDTRNKWLCRAINRVNESVPNAKFVSDWIKGTDICLLKDKREIISRSDLVTIQDGYTDEMANIINTIKINAFILIVKQNKNSDMMIKGLSLISSMNAREQQILLFKKNKPIDENLIYIHVNDDDKHFYWVRSLYNELQKKRRVVLVSERQHYSGLIGFVKQMNKEKDNKLTLVVVDDYNAPTFDPNIIMYKEQIEKNLTINIFKNGHWGGVYALPTNQSVKVNYISVTAAIPGDFDSLMWSEALPVTSKAYTVQVAYAGISGKDPEKVVTANGDGFGLDFSGLNDINQKVMGLVSSRALCTYVQSDPELLWPVPEHWTLQEAATVPLPYALAYYCFGVKGRLHKWQTVFVNGGAGAIGQAVISVCLAVGCTVYTAVGDRGKKLFLKKLFPQLKENHIGYSRDEDFYNMIVFNSNNKGCDFVVNCVTGTTRLIAMKCVGFLGYFMDLSDYDFKNNQQFGMFYLELDRAYLSVQLSSIYRPENINDKKRLQILISEGIANGTVRPLSHVIYSPEEVSNAFRLISRNRHRGRVLIQMTEQFADTISIVPRITLSASSVYLVVCGQDVLDIQVIERLINRGARKLCLSLGTKSVSGFLQTELSKWKEIGVTIKISWDSLHSVDNTKKLLRCLRDAESLEGIFIVQQPTKGIIINVSCDDFADHFNKSALVVANLDKCSRDVPELREFVVITSSSNNVVCEYASSSLEKICEMRNDDGLPALHIRVETLDKYKSSDVSVQSQLKPQTVHSVLSAMEICMRQKYTNVVTFDTKKKLNILSKLSGILGHNIKLNEIDENVTVENLVDNVISLEEIRALVKSAYRIDYTVEKVKSLTIRDLKCLNEHKPRGNTKFDSGLGAFFTFIDDDEHTATEPLVSLPSKISSQCDDEKLDANDDYIFMVPGFEGNRHIFKSIAERLKLRVIVCQLGPNLINPSIQETSREILKFIKSRFHLKSKFYLFGYSFGVNIVLEMAALFEKEGMLGTVFCLDSSPDALKVQLDAYIGEMTNADLQNTVAYYIYYLVSGKENIQFKKDLKNLDHWHDKVEACVKNLCHEVSLSSQYIKDVLDAAYSRISLAYSYEPCLKLDSEIALIKGIAHPNAKNLPDDYNLSKYTKRPVKVFNIVSDHGMAPEDSRISNIVNNLLDPVLIETFKKENLCELYFGNSIKQ